jgi:2,3-dihydroxy-p-cumate/2,3-dihydroxybenzoate 3,4-dioxygenase
MMINLHDIRYVRLGTPDVNAAIDYATRILGLEVARREGKSVYFKSDNRDHTLVYFEGDPADHTSAFEVDTPEELDSAAAQLEAKGFKVKRGSASEAEQRYVREFINFQDPSGNNIDLVYEAQDASRRYFPTRDAGITGFSHIGLCTLDARRDEQFWTSLMGAKVSDRIGDAPLLRIDEVHHKIALFPAKRAGVQHINHQVESVDDVMRAYYMMLEKGIPIRFGPGRHATSGAIFLYFAGPDGMVYEYSTGVRLITEEDENTYRPRAFPGEVASFCIWGSKPDIPEFQN